MASSARIQQCRNFWDLIRQHLRVTGTAHDSCRRRRRAPVVPVALRCSASSPSPFPQRHPRRCGKPVRGGALDRPCPVRQVRWAAVQRDAQQRRGVGEHQRALRRRLRGQARARRVLLQPRLRDLQRVRSVGAGQPPRPAARARERIPPPDHSGGGLDPRVRHVVRSRLRLPRRPDRGHRGRQRARVDLRRHVGQELQRRLLLRLRELGDRRHGRRLWDDGGDLLRQSALARQHRRGRHRPVGWRRP